MSSKRKTESSEQKAVLNDPTGFYQEKNYPQNTTPPAACWFLVELAVDPRVEDIISYALWDAGTTGIVTIGESGNLLRLGAYFQNRIDLSQLRSRLSEALAACGENLDALKEIGSRLVKNEDWLRRWKESYKPFTIGEKFLIAPSWKRPVDAGSRLLIEIDPGMAFGTGTHETTRLCLEAIEGHWRGGSLLDVGTGTGILAIAAARLTPDAVVEAFDVDVEAVQVAQENLRINGVEDRVALRAGSIADYISRQFDMVVANLTADVIILMLADLAACLSPGGKLVLSGILCEQASEVNSALASFGLKPSEVKQLGEWIAIIAEKAITR